MSSTDPRFWDARFRAEGAMWGERASASAEEAERVFREHGVETVLVPGCAYGRQCVHFAREGFEVVGLDTSEVGLAMAARSSAEAGLDIRFAPGDVAAMPFDDDVFDAIYERALLHLMLAPEREKAVAEYHRVLKPGGWLYLTDLSTEDPRCGQGEEVEPHTFDAKGGKPVHFFDEQDLRALLRGFAIHDMRVAVETEDHGGAVHRYPFWRVVAERQ
jgi:SAM-dependent methyltransferase